MGQFQNVGYQTACIQADKLIVGTDRGYRPSYGVNGPTKGPKASQQPYERARLFCPMYQNILLKKTTWTSIL